MNELVEMVLRLALAGVLGGVIGAEREYRGKVAGTRTHLLVALGSALMLLVSQHGFGGQGDPGRVAAQIVSGIGFIGAGAIMVDRQSVHGLTTAAGIWVAAGIGMATAAELYGLAIGTTVLVLIDLEVFGILLFHDHHRKHKKGGQKDIDNVIFWKLKEDIEDKVTLKGYSNHSASIGDWIYLGDPFCQNNPMRA